MSKQISNNGPSMMLEMATMPELPKSAHPAFAPAAEGVQAAAKPRAAFSPRWRTLGSFLLIVLLSAGSYAAISRFLLETVSVVGISMTPTLHENGRYLLNRWAYHDHEPQRNDIVVLRDPSDQGYAVKRVIATAGETILFNDGVVYINGKPLDEPYLAPGTSTFGNSGISEKPITCGKGQFYVLGDNRPRSIDSRSYGPVPRENILGLIVVK